jgi:Methylmalonyl-CoA mutase
MVDDTRADLEAWATLAERETGGRAKQLVWQTPEGIEVKPLFTAADLEGIEAVGSLPGLSPYLRGRLHPRLLARVIKFENCRTQFRSPGFVTDTPLLVADRDPACRCLEPEPPTD